MIADFKCEKYILLASDIHNPDNNALKDILETLEKYHFEKILPYFIRVLCPKERAEQVQKDSINWTIHPYKLLEDLKEVICEY